MNNPEPGDDLQKAIDHLPQLPKDPIEAQKGTQQEVEKLVRQQESAKAQKEIDAAVREMEERQGKLDATNQTLNNQNQDASPKCAPSSEPETQGEDTNYYNGISQ